MCLRSAYQLDLADANHGTFFQAAKLDTLCYEIITHDDRLDAQNIENLKADGRDLPTRYVFTPIEGLSAVISREASSFDHVDTFTYHVAVGLRGFHQHCDPALPSPLDPPEHLKKLSYALGIVCIVILREYVA